MKLRVIILFSIITLAAACTNSVEVPQKFEYAKAASVQLSASHLNHIDTLLADYLESNKLPGGVAMVIRNGQIVKETAFGHKDFERQQGHRMDDIFRIASMTKAITAVGALILIEEGKMEMETPLWWYIPEFRNPTILTGIDMTDSSFTSKPATGDIKIRHLFNHTSGIGYGFQNEEYNALIIKHGITEGFESGDILLEDNIKTLAGLPLLHEPGEKWTYGLSYDVLGRVIEVVSGQPLDVFLKERIFEPLGMNDTYFYLPDSEFDRMPDVFMSSHEGVQPTTYDRVNYPMHGARKYLSGGADLSTTALDYAKFAQMIMNNGQFNNQRILGSRTVEWITQQQVDGGVQGIGWGFGVMENSNDMLNYRSPGSCEWGGYFSTTCLMDPKEKLIVLTMLQMDPNWEWDVHTRVQNIVYSAVID